MTILYMFLAILMFPAILLVVLGFWALVGHICDRIYLRYYPGPAPYCDIDPLCHSAFVWDQDRKGYGWIGDVSVCITKKDRVVIR